MRIAVIGGTGQIGARLVTAAQQAGHQVVGVSRHRPADTTADWRSVDAGDPSALAAALRGVDVAVATLSVRYAIDSWREQWVPLARSVVTAVRDAGTPLVWLDNCYPYGVPRTPISEQTPLAPCSAMGRVRAEVQQVLDAAAGQVPITVARSADFLGPGVESTLVPWSSLVRAARPGTRGTRLPWIGDPHTSHQYAAADEVAAGLLALAQHAAGQTDVAAAPTTWILPALAPVTGHGLCSALAGRVGHPVTPLVAPRPLLTVAGWFSPLVRASNDMDYLGRKDFHVDDSRFRTTFGWGPAGTVETVFEQLG